MTMMIQMRTRWKASSPALVRSAAATLAALATLLSVPSGLTAQTGIEDLCDLPGLAELEVSDVCAAAAQGASSAQAVMGLAYSGGSANIGYSDGGLRLGAIPRASFGIRLNAVQLRMPDLISDQVGGDPDGFLQKYGIVVPAGIVDGSFSLYEGTDLSPSVGGIGGLSLIGTASYIPLPSEDGFDGAGLAWGVGARVRLLRESFKAPAIALTVVRRSLNRVSFGDVCPGGTQPLANPDPAGPELLGCAGEGDDGEIGFDLTNWSSRLTMSKKLSILSGTLGVGYDRNSSDLNFGARSSVDNGAGVFPLVRFENLAVKSSGWNAFAGASLNVLIASFTGEVGWAPGHQSLERFKSLASEFDPEDGNFFGSFGVRIAL
jgi:hypothetical protein